jgi:hypothetical protein
MGAHPFWPIAAIALITAVAMLWLFGKISNQKAIRIIRQGIRGNLLAVRLYQHDLKTVMQLQWRILIDTFHYLRYSLGPFLLMVIPIILILAQLQLYFSVRPLRVDESVVVIVAVDEPALLEGSEPDLEVDPEQVEIETPAVRTIEEGEVAWRLRALQPGRHELVVRIANQKLSKDLVVGDNWSQVAFQRSRSALSSLLFPGERVIPAQDPFSSFEIQYRPLPILIWGWDFHWLLLFFLLSLIFVLLLRKPMGVEI